MHMKTAIFFFVLVKQSQIKRKKAQLLNAYINRKNILIFFRGILIICIKLE